MKHSKLVGAGRQSHVAPFDAFWGQRYATVSIPTESRRLFAPLG